MRRKNTKAQVAMEYIVTYGWALLAVMVLVGGLSFFGIFRPEDSLPEGCSISTDIECKDFTIHVTEISGSQDQEYVKFYVRNINREDLYVKRLQCLMGEAHNMSIAAAFPTNDYDPIEDVGILRTNRFTTITCGGSGNDTEVLQAGSKSKAEIIMDIYTDNSFPHQIRGEIIANVKQN